MQNTRIHLSAIFKTVQRKTILEGVFMPGKRSKHKKIQRFCCAYCDRRLWSLGNPKHFLCYLGFLGIGQNVVDTSSWLEEFICGEHGKLWMKVTRKTSDIRVVALATSRDWQQTMHKLPPETLNQLKDISDLKKDFYISKGQ